ncbi:MAG: flagellar protein FlgN [Lachnospiraceae bacterium]|nr:flagellar protein FlgN [Ruminococcus sp.]MCM1276135.1 flagellar protein FlgN [Lachnospiraceae bacterium]
MDRRTADAVVKCLEIDVDFYRELTVFLMKKHTKILADDLDWLTNSLNDEQAYLMKSRSLEDKRLELFKGLGISDKKLKELIEEAPEDYRPKMNMLYKQLEELIDNIRELNSQTTEIVKRKLDNQKEFVARAGILEKPETYNRNASKVAGGQSSAQVFRQV